MPLVKQLEIAQNERNAVPLGDWKGFCKAQEKVRQIYMQLAK